MNHKGPFDQVVTDYEILEPGDTDSWNPLKMDGELAYRLSLFCHVTIALRHCGIPLESLRVLDIGCGNGRSTRMYLDLGLYPNQLTGVDLREGAIRLAKRLHPAIDFYVIGRGAFPAPNHAWNWISLTTVFSSIKAQTDRHRLADEICQKLHSGGHLFYFDRIQANSFAGGDAIDPRRLFKRLKLVWFHEFNASDYHTAFSETADLSKGHWTVKESRSSGASKGESFRQTIENLRKVKTQIKSRVQRAFGEKMLTHEAVLFEK